jgi:SAM-dependent methyltransferase
MQYVNLGCGSHYDSTWMNIDIVSDDPKVIQYNLRKGIPLPDESCDVVYHSHIIEHFRKDETSFFLKECYRILKPGGIVRIAAPDLEKICRMYLECLEACKKGDLTRDQDYEWMMLELYDQTVREKSGGRMAEFCTQVPLANEAFVVSRIGELQKKATGITKIQKLFKKKWSFGSVSLILGKYGYAIQRPFLRLFLGRDELNALEIGKFRLSGEVHQWMYDAYSMKKILMDTGFLDPVQKKANESEIPDFNQFHLDTLSDGSVRKPDSFFMEAKKPVRTART